MTFIKNLYNKLYCENHDSLTLSSNKTERSAYIDNIKFLLITLVVVGHVIDLLSGNGSETQALDKFIYLFHMPCFLILSGYLAKTKNSFKNGLSFFVLYTIMQTIFGITNELLDSGFTFKFFSPQNGLWYLLTLSAFYILLPLLSRLPKIPTLIICVIAGILAGYDNSIGTFASISRIIVYLPFFLTGYYMSEGNVLNKPSAPKWKIISLVYIIMVGAVLLIGNQWLPKGLLTSKYSYSKLDFDFPMLGGLYRLGYYAAAILMCFAVITLIPRMKMPFSKLGQRTLQIYIIHLFLFIFLIEYDVIKTIANATHVSVTIVLAIIFTFLLAWKPLGKPFDFILKSCSKLIKKDE